MKGADLAKNPEFLIAGVALVIGLYLVYRVANGVGKGIDKAGAAIGDVVDKVNPASQNNVVQSTLTAIYQLGNEKRAQQGLTASTGLVDLFNFGGVNSYDPNK